MERRITSILILLIGGQHFVHAQINQSQWLDIELSNYQYSFPVCSLKLNNQNQQLNMAYMDVKPGNKISVTYSKRVF